MSATSELPTVSVLLPVFNGRATFPSALRSILCQTYTDFELLVIDDGSTDGTGELARGCGDTRVRVIGDGSRRGLAARLNEGIDAARGRYIARMDADDICFPDRLERQIRALNEQPEIDLIGCRAVVFRTNGELVGLFPFAPDHEAICRRPWRGFYLPHPSWMGRAAWFRRYRYAYPEVVRAEDQDLLLRSFRDSRFACLPDVLLAYRMDRFNLRKTWVARRHWLKAQICAFVAWQRWGDLARAVGCAIIKAGVDVIASAPGCSSIFFSRMGEPVPADIRERLVALGVIAE